VKFKNEVNQKAQIQINSMLKDEIECKKKNQNKKFSKVKIYIYIYISKE
jgi:hypothetical protein